MGTKEKVVRKGRIPCPRRVEVPVPANSEKAKVVFVPKPVMMPA